MLQVFGRIPQTQLDVLGSDHGQRTAKRNRADQQVQLDGLDAHVAPRLDWQTHGAPAEGFRTQQHTVVCYRRSEDCTALVDENGK